MFSFDDITNENSAEHNSRWPCIPDHLYMLIIGGSGLEKTNALRTLIREQDSDKLIEKIYLYT